MSHKKALKIFKTLVETLNYRETGERCHISTSGVTRTIQNLEHELGIQLFERDNRKVTLTQKAQLVYKHALKILDEYERLAEALSLVEDTPKGVIRLFCTVTASYIMVPKITKALRLTHPDIQLHIETGQIRNIYDTLNLPEVDAVISILNESIEKSFASATLLQTNMVLVCPNNMKVKQADDAFKHYKFIMPVQYIQDKLVESWIKTCDYNVSMYGEVEGNEAVLSLVNSGVGISVLPKAVVEFSPLKASVKTFEITDMPTIRVGIIMKKSALESKTKRAFLQLCSQLVV
ncbi:LysR substrate-binding domain-containing protein [Fangia hongkongensis]|uniref:LysR substrate-binding domain-containing protein n=1 Tax=Fangia hongkongensis TaxID=270495 RepID=UPI00037C95F7|nr:LysR substrate-binding domain-containing protein [Fangia hongkongensis]MBK2125138.1 LysR family transcriptional regulator [Fangia hongkongensis]